MDEKHITPVTITLTLKDSQFDSMNKWRVSFDGEERLVPNKNVTFYCMTIVDAITRFKQSEVERIIIDCKL